MNNLYQFSKIAVFSLLMAFIVSSCSKTEPLESAIVACDFVSINITNSLDEEIKGMEINGVVVGDIQSGQSITDICLENLMVDMYSNFIALQIIGTYDNILKGENFGYCGVGMFLTDTGVFTIDITEVFDHGFSYTSL